MKQYNPVERLFRALSDHPDRVAFEHQGRPLTYGELDTLSRRYATGLSGCGVEPGDRVANLAPAGFPLLISMLGAYRIGAIHVPINTRYREAEIGHILADSRARWIVVDEDSPHFAMLDRVPQAPPRIVIGTPNRAVDQAFDTLLQADPQHGPPRPSAEDTALLIYTSGTTGRSKGVQLSYRAVVANILALTTLWAWTPNDVLVLALPLFHVHGLGIGVHGVLLHGCRAQMLPKFTPRAVAAGLDDGGTIFMGVPTMYALLAQAMDDDPTIAPALRKARLLTSGSAALSVNLFERFEAETGHRILERYGMSETLLTLSNPYDGERRRGAVGLPVDGCQVRVVNEEFEDTDDGEVGQILVRGDSLFSGYWELPKQTQESFHDGWFITGDAATRAADGYISIVGRRSVDIIKSGGFKIGAREIEEVLEQHPDVQDVVVLGLPDPVWGERITAFVVSENPTEALAESLRTHSAQTLAEYKQVREVRFVDAIPRNALGKPQKHLLRPS